MKSKKKIVIEIDTEGNSTIDLEGFHGQGCADIVKAFRDKDTVKVSRNKPEFHKQEEKVKVQQ